MSTDFPIAEPAPRLEHLPPVALSDTLWCLLLQTSMDDFPLGLFPTREEAIEEAQRLHAEDKAFDVLDDLHAEFADSWNVDTDVTLVALAIYPIQVRPVLPAVQKLEVVLELVED